MVKLGSWLDMQESFLATQDAEDQTWLGDVKGKWPTYGTIAPAYF